MDNFTIYAFGYAILMIGVIAGLFLLGIPPTWLVVIGAVMAGLGIMSGVAKTKRRES